jgi:hypothetical protein
MNNNTISNNAVNNTNTGTAETAGFNLGGASTYSLDNNTISNIGININAASTVVMTVSGIRALTAIPIETYTNNTISQLYLKGSGTSTASNVINGIYSNTTSGTKTFTNNNINTLYSLSTFSASISGIRNNTGIAVNISKNKIYGFYPGQNSTAGNSIAKGISLASLSGTGIANIYNNFISIDLSTGVPSGASGTAINTGTLNTDGTRGIEFSSTQEPGEGEHKLFLALKDEKNIIIYGLDADLILLCLQHLKDIHISLLRESEEWFSLMNICKLKNHIPIPVSQYIPLSLLPPCMLFPYLSFWYTFGSAYLVKNSSRSNCSIRTTQS